MVDTGDAGGRGMGCLLHSLRGSWRKVVLYIHEVGGGVRVEFCGFVLGNAGCGL